MTDSPIRNFFVVVVNDHNILVEADRIEEVLQIVDEEFSDVNLDFDKFTSLPITDVYMIEEDDEDKEENLPFSTVE